jgi:hypothetical protein
LEPCNDRSTTSTDSNHVSVTFWNLVATGLFMYRYWIISVATGFHVPVIRESLDAINDMISSTLILHGGCLAPSPIACSSLFICSYYPKSG